MSRKELATMLCFLIESGELTSIEDYGWRNRRSRTWATHQLADTTKWIRIEFGNKVYFLKTDQ